MSACLYWCMSNTVANEQIKVVSMKTLKLDQDWIAGRGTA